MRLTNESIAAGVFQAKANTWGSRYHPTYPSIVSEGAIIRLVDGNLSMELNAFDEIVLSVILKFCFCPVWLIKQFYDSADSGGLILFDKDVAESKINDWITFGLVWKEVAITGEYVRPTYQLFKLFAEQPGSYTNIPFNMLTHTIVEEHMMFEVMTGRSPICERERKLGTLLPRVSELGFEDDPEGTNVIGEEDFRNPNLYTPAGILELSQAEHDINNAIKNGAQFSPELENFRLFTSVKKVNNTGNIRTDYKFHVPDLVIPCLRKNGRPQSIAIEMELSNKRGGYEETMERYKDSNRFGVVYWMCSQQATVVSLRNAFQAVGGTGSTRCVLMEYTIPYPKDLKNLE